MEIKELSKKFTLNAKLTMEYALDLAKYEINLQILSLLRKDILLDNKELYVTPNTDRIIVDPIHIFVSTLLNRDSLSCKILVNMGFNVEAIVRAFPEIQKVEELIKKISEGKSDLNPLQLSEKSVEIIEKAYQISNSMQHIYVGTEHIFLSILSFGDLDLVKELNKLGITTDSYLERLITIANYPTIQGAGFDNNRIQRGVNNLRHVGVDLVELAKLNKLDPVIGREDEIDQLVNILSRRRKNNAVVAGEAGVGKTALVEGLAQRIAKGQVPNSLSKFKVISIDIPSIIASSKMRGDVEEKMAEIVDYVIKSTNVILFIDEMQNIITSGSPITGTDITSVLKPALLHPDFRCVGTTTTDDWNKYFDEDKALMRRFQPIFIEEPTIKESLEILANIKPILEKHHDIKISEYALKDAVILSDRFISDRFLPDKAIDLLDEATATKRLEVESKYSGKTVLEKQLDKVKKAKDIAVKEGKLEKAYGFKKNEEELKKKIKQLDENINQLRKGKEFEVGSDTIRKIISKWTGIPVGTITEEDSNTILKLDKILEQRVIGQKDAIKAVSNAIKRARANVSSVTRPWASLLFLGPTGVGKTELAKELTRNLFGDEKRLIQIDMSELIESHSISKLIGSPPGYVGYKDGGQLTEAVSRYPHSVVLFDEIEKAHPTILNILLQILEEGHLTDAKGLKVNFKNTIIILTSNIGVEEIQGDKILGFTEKKDDEKEITNAYESMKTQLLKQLKEYLRPELFNRLDDVIIFKMLKKSDAKKIVKKLLRELNERLADQLVQINVDEKVINYIVKKGFSEEYGARMLRRVLQDEVENVIADWVLRNGKKLISLRDRNSVNVVYIEKGEDSLFINKVEEIKK